MKVSSVQSTLPKSNGTKIVTTDVDSETLQKLKEISAQRGISLDALATAAIEKFLPVVLGAPTAQSKPLNLGVEFSFDDGVNWAHMIPSILATDDQGRFYLLRESQKGKIRLEDASKELAELTSDDVKPSTARECLEWYVDCCRFSTSSQGDIFNVLKQALADWPK